MSYTCDNCMKKIEGTTSFCQDCGKYMCDECNTTIHSFKAFKDHEVEVIENASSAAATTTTAAAATEEAASELCPNHNDVCARLFCEDCKELCCYHCICDGGKHCQHKIILSKDAYEAKKSGLSTATEHLTDLLQASNLGKELLESEIAGCRRAKEDAAKEASAAIEEVSKIVQKRAADLEESVNKEAESFKTSIEALLGEVKKFRSDICESFESLDKEDVKEKKFVVVRESARVEKSMAGLIERNGEILNKIAGLAESIDFVMSVPQDLFSASTVKEMKDKIGAIGNVVKGNRKVNIDKSSIVIKTIKEKKSVSKSAITPETSFPSISSLFGEEESMKKPEEEEKKEEEDKEEETKKGEEEEKKPEGKEEEEEEKKPEGEKKKGEKPKVPKKVSFVWKESISPVLRDIVELGGEDVIYVLETKTWNGRAANKPEKFTLTYQGKATEHILTDFTDSVGEARLSVGHPSGNYRLWESRAQRFGGLGGNYDGVFKDSANVDVLDDEHRVVQRTPSGRSHATVIGSEPLLMGDINVLYFYVRETDRGNNGMSLGVAPIDIDTDPGRENREECGWYFNFYEEKLYSGPPQNYRGKPYARRNEVGAGDLFRVTLDTTGPKGVLSFAQNGNDFGVAFDDIPLDKPLVPAVYFYGKGECIELCGPDFTFPEKWEETEDGAALARLPPQSAWKECPASITREPLRYILPDSRNRRIAKKTDVAGSIYSTMIGDTPIPMGLESFWKITIRNAFGKSGEEVFTGVAPIDIPQDVEKNYKECGWYLRWGRGTLYSGPPQNYKDRAYTKSQGAGTGSTVGHILDTTGPTGKLSFVVNNFHAGVAFEGIPLDKPLVPAVLLHFAGDSVELVL